MIQIREMRAVDIPLGLALCRFAGWNQIEADWRRLLTLNPNGVFVAEYDRQPCGTASVTCYGTDLAWIGMALVHPDYRRRGVAKALIRHSLDHAQEERVRCIKLDATDPGRLVYLKLGFEDERPICRYVGAKPSILSEGELPSIEEADWRDVARLDLDVFGAGRLRLLRRLAGDGASAVVKTSQGIQGYGFARRGFNASYLGPLAAADAETARRLIASLFVSLPDGAIYWDLFPDNVAARELAESFGFRVERRLTRMRRGTAEHLTEMHMFYGGAGFEMG